MIEAVGPICAWVHGPDAREVLYGYQYTILGAHI